MGRVPAPVRAAIVAAPGGDEDEDERADELGGQLLVERSHAVLPGRLRRTSGPAYRVAPRGPWEPPVECFGVKVLLVSADPEVRTQMQVTARALRRRMDPADRLEVFEATDGSRGARLAWRERPDVVLADEITSRAGAFALTKELKGADPPFGGRVIILLDRSQDEWLAEWSGADAWLVKPADPFRLADLVAEAPVTEEAG